MANVSYSSELMTQLDPDSAMPQSHRFYVVRDDQHQPMIFSLSTLGTLYLVKVNPQNGRNMLVDLSAKFGLSRKVVAFNVTQDKDLTIYLVFAEGGEAGKGSTVHIMKPVKPSECDWSGSVDLKSYLFKRNTDKDIIVTNIFLGTGDDGTGYPILVLIYSNVDGTLPPNTDVARITVNITAKTWDYLSNYHLPENARTMDDICIANVRGTRGLFTLYRIQGTQTLAFVGFPGKYGVSMTVDLPVPEGARSLATFVNDDGFTDLVIGATKGLYYLSDKACCTSETRIQPVLISRDGDDFLKSASQLYIAQTQQHISVWARNHADDVVYQQFTGLSSTQPVRVTEGAIPLLTKKQGGGVFAAILDPQSQSQTLFILGASDQLHMLKQKSATATWEPARTIDVPSTGTHSEFTSYTTQITLQDTDGATSLANTTVLLSAASLQDVVANGIGMQVGPEGQSLTTDSRGCITLVTRSPNLDAVIFTLRDVVGPVVLKQEYTIDPAQKVKDTLSKISSPQALENARLKDGTRLLDSSTAKPEAAQKVGSAFSLLGGRLDSISKGTNGDVAAAGGDWEHGESLVWEAWHWVSQKFDEFTDAVVRFAKGAWRFVVDFAGKVYNFVVETASQVLKAMHWLLEDVLGIPISKIISFLGFLFDWDDILYTKNAIVDTINFGLDWAAEGVDVLGGFVDDFFEDVKKKVANLTVPDEIKNRRQSAQGMRDTAKEGKHGEEMRNHPGGNWSNYQMEHGGVKQAKAVGDDGSVHEFSLLEDMIKPALNNFEDVFTKLSESLKLLTDAKSNLSIGDILLLIGGDIANAFLEGARILISGVIKALGSVILILKDVINHKIEIPLLSSLYRKISGGKDLTVLDAVALLMAVPTTVLFKIVHKKSPKAATDPQPHPLSEFYGKSGSLDRPGPLVQTAARSGISPNFMAMGAQAGFAANGGGSISGYSDKKHGLSPVVSSKKDWLKWWWNKFMWVWKRKSELFPILALVGNIWTAYASYGAVMAPDIPLSQLMHTIYTVQELCLFLGTVPVHPWAPKRPAPALRLLSWGSGAVHIVLRLYKVSKVKWAMYAFFVGSFQALLDVIVVIEECTATAEEYPDRPGTAIMSLRTANVVFASAAKVVLPIATYMQGGNIYFNLVGWGSSTTASLLSVAIYGVECSEGIHHPVVSLLGST